MPTKEELEYEIEELEDNIRILEEKVSAYEDLLKRFLSDVDYALRKHSR